MGKIPEPFSKTIPHVLLHKEDLEELFEVIAEAGCGSPEIVYNRRPYSPPKFLNLPHEVIHNLEIRISEPYWISLDFSENGVRIYLSSDEAAARGIGHKIEELLDRHTRLKKLFLLREHPQLSLATAFIIPAFLIFALLPVYRAIPIDTGTDVVRYGFILVVLLLSLKTNHLLFFKSYENKIKLSYKKDNPGFWKQKKHDVVLLIFGALLGAAATKILEAL